MSDKQPPVTSGFVQVLGGPQPARLEWEDEVSDTKLYAQRDHVAQGEHFISHLSAMTGEGLHAKSAIAAELAHRDIIIARLTAERDAARREALPKEPPPGLLMSMAIRYDHGLAVPGYYDKLLAAGAAVDMHNTRLEATLRTMRQLYEEVSGHGLYSPEKGAEYAAMREGEGK